jgi:hypothetical protein
LMMWPVVTKYKSFKGQFNHSATSFQVAPQGFTGR